MHFLDFHPWDWICHFLLSFVPVRFKWCTWWLAISVGIGVEYEQKTQVCYNSMSWSDYIINESAGDLVEDFSGALLANYLNNRDKERIEKMKFDDFLKIKSSIYMETN